MILKEVLAIGGGAAPTEKPAAAPAPEPAAAEPAAEPAQRQIQMQALRSSESVLGGFSWGGSF